MHLVPSRALGTRSTFLRNGTRTRYFFSKEERGTDRVPEIRGTKLRSVPRSFFPHLPLIVMKMPTLENQN